jgi:hypothetical protein
MYFIDSLCLGWSDSWGEIPEVHTKHEKYGITHPASFFGNLKTSLVLMLAPYKWQIQIKPPTLQPKRQGRLLQ